MIATILLITILLLVAAAGVALHQSVPACPGCGSRSSTPILLADAVVCAGCWTTLA